MIKQESGFTMIELLVSMVIFLLLIAAASQIFTAQLTQFKQQSKIAETNIEGIIGLEMLRRDIEHAGFGLPWVIPAGVSYSTENNDNAYNYNDWSPNSPRAIFSGNSLGIDVAGSDELIIKATNIATSDTAQRWTWLRAGINNKRIWLSDDFVPADNIIVVFPGSTAANSRTLVVDSADSTLWTTDYSLTANYAPADAVDTNIIYGINPDTSATPTMPFNRADYYISTTNANVPLPLRCATGTGVLVKAVIDQADGDFDLDGDEIIDELPLLDCVADFQVVFGLDNDTDGDFEPLTSADGYSNDILTVPLTAQQIRDQVKEVRVYILAQEGQRDPNFTFTNFTCADNCIRVGETAIGGYNDFDDLTAIADFADYRWKLYTLVVRPNNLGG